MTTLEFIFSVLAHIVGLSAWEIITTKGGAFHLSTYDIPPTYTCSMRTFAMLLNTINYTIVDQIVLM